MKNLPQFLISAGLGLFAIGILILFLTFYPVIKDELLYALQSHKPAAIQKSEQTLKPVDTEFGIVIPKIGASARVIPDVDPYNSRAYQSALAKGVAHAKGTVYPGLNGNIFLFSHSSVDFYVAIQFNSVFYLISKLEKGDDITLYFHNIPYRYKVTDKKLVDATDTRYLTMKTDKKQVTLMTCWPPGTTYKRLIVIGEL